MNTAYRLIWDDRRNMLVIVDENSSARGKNRGKRVRRAVLPAAVFSAALAGAFVAPWGGEVWAGDVCALIDTNNTTNPPTVVKKGSAPGTNALACGVSATANGNYSVAVGQSATTGWTPTLAEAKIGAYNDLQQTIKTEFANDTAVQNATTYDALVAALGGVGTIEAGNT